MASRRCNSSKQVPRLDRLSVSTCRVRSGAAERLYRIIPPWSTALHSRQQRHQQLVWRQTETWTGSHGCASVPWL
jgi:hypothetical protein